MFRNSTSFAWQRVFGFNSVFEDEGHDGKPVGAGEVEKSDDPSRMASSILDASGIADALLGDDCGRLRERSARRRRAAGDTHGADGDGDVC